MPSALLTLIDVLLYPGLWVGLIIWWLWIHFDEAFKVTVHKVFDKATARPGDLFADGNTVTSKTEMKVRNALIKSGMRLAKQGTALWTSPDHRGIPHKYTPDIIIPADKLIVEVDPEFTHGGPAKVADDLLRNQMYADIGYRVVRLRMGGAKALSSNDVVIQSSDYTDAVTPKLVAACHKAKWIPSSKWESARRKFEAQALSDKAERQSTPPAARAEGFTR